MNKYTHIYHIWMVHPVENNRKQLKQHQQSSTMFKSQKHQIGTTRHHWSSSRQGKRRKETTTQHETIFDIKKSISIWDTNSHKMITSYSFIIYGRLWYHNMISMYIPCISHVYPISHFIGSTVQPVFQQHLGKNPCKNRLIWHPFDHFQRKHPMGDPHEITEFRSAKSHWNPRFFSCFWKNPMDFEESENG